MSQELKPGDYLVFQIESGYGLLKLLGTSTYKEETIWHLTAYNDLFLDTDMVEQALENPAVLSIFRQHLALTTRAFESTQTARMSNKPLSQSEIECITTWESETEREVSDRSIRLLLGIR